MKNISIIDPRIRKIGRNIIKDDALNLFWTGSGIQIAFDGDKLELDLEAGYDSMEQWLAVMIDGFMVSRFIAQKGRNVVTILNNFKDNGVRKIEIIKEQQALGGDQNSYIAFHGINIEGEIYDLPKPSMKIEFIGDSITSGEGTMSPKTVEQWMSIISSAAGGYPYMVTNMLDAECRVISQSGWGVYRAWDNNPFNNVPRIYNQVCGLYYDGYYKDLGTDKEYDFTKWQPDLVFVNLGTNDGTAFSIEAFIDPETNITYKLRKNEDDSFNKDDRNDLKNAIIDFLVNIRTKNPNAQIIWGIGSLGIVIWDVLEDAIKEYQAKTKDEKVLLMELPVATAETMGAKEHPGILSHQQAAKCIVDKIKELKLV